MKLKRRYAGTLKAAAARRRKPLSRKDRIDLGLALLARRARRGEPFTLEEIAAYCGTSITSIFDAERKALRKLRRRFLRLAQQMESPAVVAAGKLAVLRGGSGDGVAREKALH